MAERDGIVGLFHGEDAHGRRLDTVRDAADDVGYGVLDITTAELVDNGSTILARITVAEIVPEQMADGEIEYRIFLDFGDHRWAAGIEVTASGRRGFTSYSRPPRVVGYRVQGATIEIPISKTVLNGRDHFSWDADAVWWGRDFDRTERRTVRVREPDHDLSAMAGTVNGNAFEVFHYPTFPKRGEDVLSFIYGRAPANDEIAVTFTDFRIDDLYGTGPGSGPINAPIQGIGRRQANPSRGDQFGSQNLLVTMATVFIGAPNWTETGVSGDRAFHNFAKGVRWVAHEAVHRWGVTLEFRNPRSGRIEPLADRWGHWHWLLHAPAVDAMWPAYASEPLYRVFRHGWRSLGGKW